MASHYMSAASSQNNPAMDYSLTSSGSMTITGSPDVDINSNMNDEFLATLDPTNDIANDILVNQSFDYSTSNTTPEFAAPPKNDYLINTHVLSENYSYSFPSDEDSHHHHSLSLPIDQLNLLSLKPLSSHNSQAAKAPSPEYTHAYIKDVQFDDRTINPKQLYSKQPPTLKSAKKSASNTNLTGLAVANDKYILPSSSASPNLASFFNVNLNKFDFQMNNECLDAISYWLTNNQTNDNKDIIVNPTGIIKNSYYKRRNSIQLTTPAYVPEASPATANGIQKRKRRKSYNYGYRPEADINEIKYAVSNDINTGNESASSAVSITPKEKFPPISLPAEQEEGKPFPCPECSKQFKRSEHLKRHIRSVHSNIRPFHCKYCEKQFSRSDNLAQHLKTHYKVNTNGTTTIIYGNPNLHNRGGRRKNTAESVPQTMA